MQKEYIMPDKSINISGVNNAVVNTGSVQGNITNNVSSSNPVERLAGDAMPPLQERVDILIVTVTKVESLAVMNAFREETGTDGQCISIGDRVYHDLGKVNGMRIVMAISEMGSGHLGSSQQTVQKAIGTLRPSAIIMVGIAFGVNQHKQSIGEILISKQLWLYDLQRVGKHEIIPRGDKPSASPGLIGYLRSADMYWSGAQVHFGLILTGEKLVDNIDYRDQLKRFESEAIGGEMEGAGLYVACQDAHIDWVLVKAICDWADGNKSFEKDTRQQDAADNAARFVLHALRLVPFNKSS
jgi:nucleoside phosphorylase